MKGNIQPPSGIKSDKTNSYMRGYLQGNILAVVVILAARERNAEECQE
jgi:hypothetical protein